MIPQRADDSPRQGAMGMRPHCRIGQKSLPGLARPVAIAQQSPGELDGCGRPPAVYRTGSQRWRLGIAIARIGDWVLHYLGLKSAVSRIEAW
eukprot:14712812-Heterocapsa_arctica.AAC.1